MNKTDFHNISLTTFIYGAGAVENAWEPIKDVVKSTLQSNLCIDGDMANSFLTRMVFLMRFYNASEIDSVSKQGFKIVFDKLKKDIATSLKTAQRENIIKPQKELQTILEKFIPPYTNVYSLTTNWDIVIETAIQRLYMNTDGSNIQTTHIHGSILDSEIIYLPSEIVGEQYRSKEEDAKLGTLHKEAYSIIGESQTIILYGISFDPLDAELSQILAVGLNESPAFTKIIIINPDYQKVANRVKMLLPNNKPFLIEAYEPNKLEICHTYLV